MSSPSDYQVRRATIDDLQNLLALWTSMRLPAVELEKHLTEFQVAVAPDGTVVGAIGMQILGRHGRLHSEAFSDFSLADPLRERLWQRMQSLASNHGLVRVWTLEDAPYWAHTGFQPANAEALKKLPEPWQKLSSQWLTLPLRAEEALETPVDKDFSRFMEAEKERTAAMLQTAKTVKAIAAVLAIILALLVIVVLIYTMTHRSRLQGH